MQPGVDAVVCNYRTPRDLRDFLQSWEKYREAKGRRLTIVNVAPTPEDMRVAAAAAANLADVDVITFASNVGYARACNQGSVHGDSEVLAFFNADVVLTCGAVESCYHALSDHDDWAVLGPRQVDARGRITHAGIIGPNEAPGHRGWYQRDVGQYEDILDDVPTVSGAAYFIKRKIWDELASCDLYREVAPDALGAFLPTQHYYEETFCSYHARAHGWKCVYYGAVTVIHKYHQASPTGGFADAQMPKSRGYFRRACAHHRIGCD